MSIKISELPQAANVGNNDFVPIVQNGETKKALASDFGGGGGGTSDYTDLTNKPSINSVTLTGDKTSGDLNLVGTGDIATTIDSTSTNSEVAGAKAVYDATLDNYSTTEQVVGTWIDGKPVYELTIIDNALSLNNGNATLATTVANVENVCSSECYVGSPNTAGWRQGYLNSNYYSGLQCSVNPANELVMSIYAKEALNSIKAKVIVRYTKTTDTATNSLNASLMNTGSLVGMGDRAELLGNTETEVETKESGDTL